ncbi:MAG: PadR family transcriptional regulator [Sporomusaceae bacterium]|nr:PadR family transcriptional regulator [Sporomusaceae bacterium]
MPDQAYVSYMKLVLGLYILKILEQEKMHGNQLAERIVIRTGGAYRPNTNALYPLLRSMEEKGYVTGHWQNPNTRSKRIYEITADGIKRLPELEAMLAERLKQIEVKIALLREDLLGFKNEL